MDYSDIELQEFEKAAERLKPFVHCTNIVHSSTFSSMTGAKVYLKCENLQKTGSFKIRGASNKIACLRERGGVDRVIASSAGNHAQGVAYSSHYFGIPATIVMPESSPISKIEATENYGAKVILYGSCYDDAHEKACEICERENAVFLHPYNDPEVIAGQGTIGLEILAGLPETDIIVVPAGGGGLLSGIAACVKKINPRIKIIGVQAEGCAPIALSFHEKRHITIDKGSTIADGIAVKSPGELTISLINRYADDVVTVSDNDISSAALLLMERCKMVVEPSGAASVAAVLSGKLKDIEGKRIVCVLSGGNVDISFVESIIEHGLFASSRRLKFSIVVNDSTGALAEILSSIASLRASVLFIENDKMAPELNPNETCVTIACEVRNKAHGEELLRYLEKKGYKIKT